MVYLFLTPLQQNSGHYIPFPQPENLKSRAPFFFEKLAALLFSGLPLLGPLQQNSGHYIPFPQPENLKTRVLFFSRKIGNSTFHGFRCFGPLLPCYFCSSRPSTARPPRVHRIIPFNLAPPSLASSHAISAPPARPQPVHRIIHFNLAPPSLASSHAISAAPARPQPVHRPSTGSSPSISLLHL